jgi:hypothetical protein
MSFSMLEPEEEPICECRYDEARDAMDREDCPFHCDIVDEFDTAEAPPVERKRPEAIAREIGADAA